MIELLSRNEWSPYIVGAAIGILGCLTFILSDKAIGCSTAFTRTSGMIEVLARGRKVREMPYYRQFVPEVDWEWMLVVGIFLGAYISAMLSGEFKLKWLPDLWINTFGEHHFVRLAVAFAGGMIMGLGARWAGGCTSGHGISGTMQLAASSWLAVLAFFTSGVGTAFFIYHVIG